MLNPFKLIKSKPLVEGLQKDLTTMNKTNWKTNTLGAIALVIGLAQIWAPPAWQKQIQATSGVLAGAGLIAAKDHDN